MGMKIFTANTTFNVASLGLPADTCFDIVCVGGGGGGGAGMWNGSPDTGSPTAGNFRNCGSGGGSGYPSYWSGKLSGSHAVTVGPGGNGGYHIAGQAPRDVAATAGGTSSFGAICSALGGQPGTHCKYSMLRIKGGAGGAQGGAANACGSNSEFYGSGGGGAGGLDLNSPYSFSPGGDAPYTTHLDATSAGACAGARRRNVTNAMDSPGNGGGAGGITGEAGRSRSTGGSGCAYGSVGGPGGGGGGYGGGGGGAGSEGAANVVGGLGNRGAQGGNQLAPGGAYNKGGNGAPGVVILFW